MNVNYENIITIEPGKRGGRPCIRGMRITVYDILSYLAAGMTTEEILQDFPYLTKEDILAALSFVAEREGRTLRGFPPQVVWLRVGNCTTNRIEDLLRANHKRIERMEREPTIGILSLF